MAEAYDRAPMVSIGLPVFNGDNYLQASIESILAQTFTDFELIISDNASTDRTEEIARQFAARDGRVRYYRNEKNIGGANNQNATVQLSRGRYFRVAAHDDLMAPTLLEECVAVLERRPEVVLCYPATIDIDDAGNVLREHTVGRGMASRPSERFAELAFRDYACEPTYGLIRADILRMTTPMENYTDSDRVFLSELAMHGPFFEIPRPLFYKRIHSKNIYVDWRARMAWYDPTKKGRVTLPNWLQLAGFVRAVATAKIEPRDRAGCVLVVGRWVVRYSPKLMKDLIVAVQVIVSRGRSRKPEQVLYNWE